MANYFSPYFNHMTNLRNIRKAAENFTSQKVQSGSPDSKKDNNKKNFNESSSLAKPFEKTVIQAFQPTVDEKILSIDRDDLLRGIIFSEILGAPKGRRTGRW